MQIAVGEKYIRKNKITNTFNECRVMTISEGYVTARNKGCGPFVCKLKEFKESIVSIKKRLDFCQCTTKESLDDDICIFCGLKISEK